MLPLLAALGAMAAFQTGAASAKSLFSAIGPEGAATLRLGFGAVMLTVLTRPWRHWPERAPLKPLLGLGVSMACAVQFFYLAIDHLPLGVAICLQFLGPLGVALAGSRRAGDLVWTALAAAGVWALVGAGRGPVPLEPVGIAYALGAAAGWAGYILSGRLVGAAFGRAASSVSVSIAALLILPLGVWRAGPALLDPTILPLALFVAMLATAIPFWLELYALPRLPARTFATFTSLEPAFGVLSGLVILHERLSLVQTGGVVLVIAAAGGAAWSGVERPAVTADTPPA